MPLDEANIKVIIQEYMEDKVVYRDNCKERHKDDTTIVHENLCTQKHQEVSDMKTEQRQIKYLLITVLGGIITTLITVLLK